MSAPRKPRTIPAASVATPAHEPEEPTPGEQLEAGHRRFVERIREQERKEPSA